VTAPAWRFRPATPDDADLLVALEAEAFGAASWGGRAVADGLAEPRVGAVIGFCAGDQDASAFCLWRDLGDEAEILTIGVAPHRRKAGGGGAALEDVEARLRASGARAIFLEVNARNDAALALYRRRGFYGVGRRARYYASGDDAVVMRLDL
jgi:ribosomal-protein-alanine N-acetyltransferase